MATDWNQHAVAVQGAIDALAANVETLRTGWAREFPRMMAGTRASRDFSKMATAAVTQIKNAADALNTAMQNAAGAVAAEFKEPPEEETPA